MPVRDLVARVRAALATVLGHDEDQRWVNLAREHGGRLGGVAHSYAEVAVRETALRCAGRERVALSHLAQLINTATEVTGGLHEAGPSLPTATDQLTKTAAEIGQLVAAITADRHHLSVLAPIVKHDVKQDQTNPTKADRPTPADPNQDAG